MMVTKYHDNIIKFFEQNPLRGIIFIYGIPHKDILAILCGILKNSIFNR